MRCEPKRPEMRPFTGQTNVCSQPALSERRARRFDRGELGAADGHEGFARDAAAEGHIDPLDLPFAPRDEQVPRDRLPVRGTAGDAQRSGSIAVDAGEEPPFRIERHARPAEREPRRAGGNAAAQPPALFERAFDEDRARIGFLGTWER